MKVLRAAVLILAMGITGISLWATVHARHMAVSSSQIFIEGTPVCVVQRGEDIVASVGTCDPPGDGATEDGFGEGDAYHGSTPSPINPQFGLPPGHPPITSPPDMEEGRRILI